MREEEFSWGGGPPQRLIAGARLFGGPSWSPTKHAAEQDITSDHSSHGYESRVETVHVGPLADEEYLSVVCRNLSVATAIVVLLAVFQFTPPHKLSNFCARKLTHISIGVCLLVCQPVGHLYMKLLILAIGVGAIISCFVMPFRFSAKADEGIILYNIIVCVWVLLNFPLPALGPMFFADPCGAIAGKLFRSPVWTRNKTVVGSAAVFVVTFLTAFSAISWVHRLILAAVCCLMEAVGGRYDNAFITVPLAGYFFVFHNQSSGLPKLFR